MSHSKLHQSPTPLDMGQFNMVTEGKSTYQDELLKVFFSNSEECIAVMERNCANDLSIDKWQDALSELRDISNSIGALELSKICAVAEKIGISSAEERKKMLANIKLHVQRLRAFIKKR